MASDLAAFEAPCFGSLDHELARHVQKRCGSLNRQLMALLYQDDRAVLGHHAEHVGKQAQSLLAAAPAPALLSWRRLDRPRQSRHARVIERRHQANLCDLGQVGIPTAGHRPDQVGSCHGSSNSLWKVGDPQI